MSAQIKEALAALGAAQERFGQVGWFNVIRAALESAQREAVAWEAIEAWCAKSSLGQPRLVKLTNGEWYCYRRGSYGSTRIEALEAAAKWCREQVAK